MHRVFLNRPNLRRKVMGITALWVFALVPAGCSLNRQQLSHPVAGMKQLLGVSQYYVKSYATLRAKPDRTSKVQGKLPVNAKVTEISKNEVGWSQVKAADNNLQGWIPTSLLSQNPVETRAKAKTEEKTAKKTPPPEEQTSVTEAPQAVAPPSAESKPEAAQAEQSGNWLSPSPAAAEPIPPSSPANKTPSAERKAEPEMFDSF